MVLTIVTLVPTGISSPVAFNLGEKSADPIQMYLSDLYTLSTNLAGIPGLSFNVGYSNKLPEGLQLLGPWWSDDVLLGTAHAFQSFKPETVQGAML